MSVISSVILTTPFADFSPDKRVERGLEEIGFWKAPDGPWPPEADAYQVRPDPEVWLMLDRKLHFHDEGKFGIDGLRDLVLALPWHQWSAPTHLQVLWSDDFTTEDDHMGGRISPYAWRHETWELP